jgi:hypothetical protein
MVGRKFYIYLSGGRNPKEQKIEAVSSIPTGMHSSAKEAPSAAANIPGMELLFNTDGSFDVLFKKVETGAEIPSVPVGMDQSSLDKVTAALDSLDTLSAGTPLYNDYYIREAHGNRVLIAR